MRRLLLGIALLLMASMVVGQESSVCSTSMKAADKSRYEEAVEAFNEGHYLECSELMRRVAAKYPKAADPYFYLGMCSVHRDFNATGIRRYFTKLFDVCPDYPNALAHYYMAIVRYTDEEYEEAVNYLNRFFDLANNDRKPESDAVYEEASNYLHWSTFLADAKRNAVPFNPVVLRGVSSREHEMMPFLTHDGRTMYYIRQVSQNKEVTVYVKELDEKIPRLCKSVRKDSTFSSGTELTPPFNMHASEGGVTLTADNRLLYYSVMTAGRNGYSNIDIYSSRYKDGRWTPIQNAGTNINGDRTWESQPSITPDGQYLYFASNRPGGVGGIDIWRCHRLPNGDWSRAENLGSTVNTPGNEKCPFIHADGHTLYFASNGWQGFGGYDMYFIDINNSSVQCPTNMGLPINTEQDDICFGVTADGTQGYYAGKNTEVPSVGGRDVFMFDLYPAARPEGMRHHTGVLQTSSGKDLPGTVSVLRYGSEGDCYLTDSVSGAFAVMLSLQEDNLLVAQAPGFMPYIASHPAAEVRRGVTIGTITLNELKSDATYPLKGKVYDAQRGTVTEVGKQILRAYAEFLTNNPRVHLSIESRDAAEAKALYDYLLTCKLRKERLSHHAGTDIPRLQMHITM